MDTLPNELIILIFEYISKITDKRQFVRTCDKYNILTKQSMGNYENNNPIKGFPELDKNSVEKFMIELCHDKYFDMIPKCYIIPNNNILLKALSAFGGIKLLREFMELGYDLSLVCEYAANNGALDVLKWAKEVGLNMEVIICEPDEQIIKSNICANAALNGHLDILIWAKEIGLELDDLICSNAALNGHLNILIWAKEIGLELNYGFFCLNAAVGGHLDILIWAKLNDLFWEPDITLYYAIRGGNTEVLNWVKANGGIWSAYMITFAAQNGLLESLKWLHNNGCCFDWMTCRDGAGHLNILKWLHEIGCPWNSSTCEFAARANNLISLKYARENGCEWDQWTLRRAEQNHNKEMINWLLDNNCPRR